MDAVALMTLLLFVLIRAQALTCRGPKSLQFNYQYFPVCSKDSASTDSPITTLSVSIPSMCAVFCMQNETCLSVNICEDGNMWTCHLLPSVTTDCSLLETESGCVYMEEHVNPCQNGGTWNNTICACMDGFAGEYCERLIRSCQEGWDLNTRVSRHYMLQPFGSRVAYSVYCNLQYAASAIVLNRWRNPECPTGFNKTWKEYKDGWGDVKCGEYFIGLETMYQLMKYERFTIEVYGFLNNVTRTEIKYLYSEFTVNSETFNYSMNYSRGSKVVGTKGEDGLGTDRPRDFCTRDRDCGSCALKNGGGWWYSGGCGSYAMTASLPYFVWPVDGMDEELADVYLSLHHMFYL